MLGSTDLHDVNVSELIRRSGVSRPTFYFYFPTKYAVVATLVRHVFDDIFKAVGPWLEREPSDDPEATLRAGLTAAAELWTADPSVRAAHQHWHAAPELEQAWLGIMERFRATLEEQIRQIWGPDDPRDAQLHSSALIWASERILHIGSVRADPHLDTTAATVDALLAIWVPTLYNPATGG